MQQDTSEEKGTPQEQIDMRNKIESPDEVEPVDVTVESSNSSETDPNNKSDDKLSNPEADHDPESAHVDPEAVETIQLEMDPEIIYSESGIKPVRGGIPPPTCPNVTLDELKKGADPRLAFIPTVEEQERVMRHRCRVASLPIDWLLEHEENMSLRVGKVKIVLDIIDYLQKSRNRIEESSLTDVMLLISSNIFRSLPPKNVDVSGSESGEDESATYDPIYPFLRWMYEFFLKFIVNDIDPRVLKKFITSRFILNFIDLFKSYDGRERELLKNTLHRIYAKFMSLRSFIRRSMNNILFQYIYEDEEFAGVAELLEIFGSIINGFAVPLKNEHKTFFTQILLPLHKTSNYPSFHSPLSYCVTQFVEKDESMALIALTSLLKYWPVTNPTKELLFLTELELILDTPNPIQLGTLGMKLVEQLSSCASSTNYQVADRALSIFSTTWFIQIIQYTSEEVQKKVVEALIRATNHWNAPVQIAAVNALQYSPIPLTEQQTAEIDQRIKEEDAAREAKLKQRKIQWAEIASLPGVQEIVEKYPGPPKPSPESLLPIF